MKKKIIETIDLTKVYNLKKTKNKLIALDNVNISINEGEIFGLLGPNGAGKTTMIQILTTLLQPTSGYAIIDGYNVVKYPKKAKSNIALMLESDMLYYRITAYENLKFFCRIYEVPNYKEKISHLAKDFGLEKWLNQYVENFSSGMKMKLALCRTLLLDRKILFLDEPTLGLDVKSIALIIKKLKNLKKTIFLTSHDMGVVEKLCDRIAFINKGKIVKIGTKEDIKELEQKEINIEITVNNEREKLINELRSLNFINNVREVNNNINVSFKNRSNYNNLLATLTKYDIFKIQENELSLEDLFLNLV